MKRGRRHIVAIDLETGGFEPGRNSILAIGAYFRFTEDGWPLDKEWTFKIYAEREEHTEVHVDAARKCGWESDAQWRREKSAVPLVTALHALKLWLEKVSAAVLGDELPGEDGPLLEPLAHACEGVDRPFLAYWLKRFDLWDTFFGKECGLLSEAWHCSMETLRACQTAGIAAGTSSSLEALVYAMGGRKLPWPHDPLEDAKACFNGYNFLIGRMRQGRLPGFGGAIQVRHDDSGYREGGRP